MLASIPAWGPAWGCAVHGVRSPLVSQRVYIGDRGIFVPLPPPSYYQAPVQAVVVEGEFRGEAAPAGASLRVIDLHGEADLTFPLDEGQSTFAIELELDLTDNCLELWVETEAGEQSPTTRVRATIVSDDELATSPECE